MNIGNLWEVVISVSLSVFGGLAKLLQIKDKSAFDIRKVLSELVLSAFIGLMVLLFGRSLNLHGDWLGALCGISGFIGIRVIDVISKPLLSSLGADMKDKKDEKEDETEGGKDNG